MPRQLAEHMLHGAAKQALLQKQAYLQKQTQLLTIRRINAQ